MQNLLKDGFKWNISIANYISTKYNAEMLLSKGKMYINVESSTKLVD